MTAIQICALESIHHVDLVTLTTGRCDLIPTAPAIWECRIGIDPMVETIGRWSATEARPTFHQRLMDQLAIEHRRNAA